MGLSKYRLGDLIEQINNKNTSLQYGFEDVRGVSNTKGMMKTRANINDRSFDKFYIIQLGDFVFNRRTTRNGERLGLAYNDSNRAYIFTEDYVAFKIKEKDKLLSEYLYIFFQRDEFDRLVRYNSWGSATEFFNWDDMCNIEIDLPSIPIQQKYVDVYNSLLQNQKVYEKELDDLKLTCDAYIEKLRREITLVEIGSYIEKVREINREKLITEVRGVSAEHGFTKTIAKMDNVDIAKYQIVSNNDFAFTPTRINIGSIALFQGEKCVVSPFYEVFRITDTDRLLPEYLIMWLKRKEFFRYTLFCSDTSVRQTFEYNQMRYIKIPIPDIGVQQSIVNIYNAYITRCEINKRLKSQIKDICPILIRGALEEAK